MRRIAVLTSGGDAPGMNAAIRAVTRTALARGLTVLGARRGYTGLVTNDLVHLGAREVGGIIQQGGTTLGSARCAEFRTDEGQARARATLRDQGIDGLVVIGGGGSQAGALALSRQGFPVVGVASTIDNDLVGSDVTIGADTALNIALEAMDRLKVTASSHRRAAVVEVMGRDCGYLALMAGLAGGAESIVLPEVETDPETVATELRAAYERGKTHGLVVVAEGARYNAAGLARYFVDNKQRLGFDLRVTILGHVQRGGVPSAFDRVLATRLGAAAAEHLCQGRHGVLIGLRGGEVSPTPLEEVVGRRKPLDPAMLELAKILAR